VNQEDTMRARWLLIPLLLPLTLLPVEQVSQAAPVGADALNIGQYRALLIGVDDYDDSSIPDLQTPRADVMALAEVLRDQYGFDRVDTLVGSAATRGGILDALDALVANTREDDALIIYYAGHGTRKVELKQGYWLPVDAKKASTSNWISNADVRDRLQGMPARHVLLISDSCFAGSLIGTRDLGTSEVAGDLRVAQRLARDKSRWVLTSGGDEPVLDGHLGSEHSVFAHFLLKQLRDAEGPFINPGAFVDDLQRLVINNAEQSPQAAPLKGAGDEGGQLVMIPSGRSAAPQMPDDSAIRAAELRAQARVSWSKLATLRELGGTEAREYVSAFAERYAGSGAPEVGEAEAWLVAYVVPPEVVAEPEPVSSSPSVSAGTSSTGSSGYKMVSLPGGSFEMGCTAGQSDCDDDEKPVHRVTVSGFSMGATEVTQGLYRSVMGSNPSYYSSCGDDCPVETVTWYDAVKFANAMSRQEGLEECYSVSGESVSWPKGLSCTGYRLPTEAEWEYAARAGEDTLLAGGDNPDAVAWYESNSSSMTHAVGGKQANAWGLYDMSGNVWEWTWDWYQSSYQSGSSVDPVGPQSGSGRVYRGGGWRYTPRFVRVANRYRNAPSYRYNNVGLRLSRSIP